MDIDAIKRYLRIDSDEEDEDILLLEEAAREYIIDAVGECNEEKARVKLIMLNIIAYLYENRQFTTKFSEKASYALKTMLMQMSLENETYD